jgi:hypothetical protein
LFGTKPTFNRNLTRQVQRLAVLNSEIAIYTAKVDRAVDLAISALIQQAIWDSVIVIVA